MKNILDVLRQKELELQQVQAEVDALRVALRLMSEDGENYGRPLAATASLSESRVKEITTAPTAIRQFP